MKIIVADCSSSTLLMIRGMTLITKLAASKADGEVKSEEESPAVIILDRLKII
jgi:hypothetical protein